MTVLLIEDDQQIADLLQAFLEAEAIDVTVCFTTQSAKEMMRHKAYDAVILDLGLPDGSGLDLCGHIRSLYDVPIIMSTAQNAIDTKLSALTGGADDYLVKPYDPRELLARIHLILGRQPKTPENGVGSFLVDDERKQIVHHRQRLELTGAEYEILRLLIKRSGHVVTRTDIANSIESHRLESDIQSINVLISRIRKKIGPEHILTLRGLGYKFVP